MLIRTTRMQYVYILHAAIFQIGQVAGMSYWVVSALLGAVTFRVLLVGTP